MEISTRYSSASLSYATLASDTSLSAPEMAATSPGSKDHVELSDQALASARALDPSGGGTDGSLEVVRSVLAQVTGSDIEGVDTTAVAEQATVTTAAASVSVSGTVSTKDGKELAFTLDLQYCHGSYSAESAAVGIGDEGISIEYGGVAAELTGTSFGFTIAGAQEAASGKGRLHLNDQVSRIGKEIKPLAKEFMSGIGASGGWGEINRFLRASTRQQLP